MAKSLRRTSSGSATNGSWPCRSMSLLFGMGASLEK
jgi:hypothetical protein